MHDSFCHTLTDYILSGHAYLHAHTPETTRFLSALKEIAAGLPSEDSQDRHHDPNTHQQ